jgi:lipopolysaccharide export system protein LptC
MRKQNTRPDFYMEGFTMHDYSPLSNLRYQTTGKSLMRYPKDDSLEIKQLNMQSYQENKAPLSVTANTASLTDDGQQIFLTGNVIIRQDKTRTDDSMLITTEKLFIDNNRNYMETDVAINIKSSKHDVSGIGMQAWTDYKKVRLLKKVRGIHEP